MRPTAAPSRGIYAAKERPSFNPLIAHLPIVAAARREGVLRRRRAARWPQAFWPGPLTLVVPAAPACDASATSRAPGCDASRCACRRIPSPAPCWRRPAGRSRRPRPIAPAASARPAPSMSLADLDGRIDAVLDGGPTAGRRRIDDRRLPRRRAAPAAAGRRPARGASRRCSATARCRGRGWRCGARWRRACSPRTTRRAPRVRLDADAAARRARPGSASGRTPADARTGALNLSADGRSRRGGREPLRHAAPARRDRCATIAVAPIPAEGLGEAINDRLRAPRRGGRPRGPRHIPIAISGFVNARPCASATGCAGDLALADVEAVAQMRVLGRAPCASPCRRAPARTAASRC